MYQNFEKHVLKAQSRAWEISNNLKPFNLMKNKFLFHVKDSFRKIFTF